MVVKALLRLILQAAVNTPVLPDGKTGARVALSVVDQAAMGL
jgi:hypothetical protein